MRKTKRCMIVPVLVFLGMGMRGESASQGHILTWMQRAFAPTQPKSLFNSPSPLPSRLNNSPPNSEFAGSKPSTLTLANTFQWVRRALAPSLRSPEPRQYETALNFVRSHAQSTAFCNLPNFGDKTTDQRRQCPIASAACRRSKASTDRAAKCGSDKPFVDASSRGWTRLAVRWAQKAFSSFASAPLPRQSGLTASTSAWVPVSEPSLFFGASGGFQIPLGADDEGGESGLNSGGADEKAAGDRPGHAKHAPSIDGAVVELLKQAAAHLVHALTSGFPLIGVNQALHGASNASQAEGDAHHDQLRGLAMAALRALPLEAASDNWQQVQHLYEDGAEWISNTPPAEGLKGAFSGAGHATAALLSELSRLSVALFEEEVGRIKSINDAGQATLSRLGQATLARLAEANRLLAAVIAEEEAGLRLLSGAGQATLARLAEANRVLGGVVEDEIGRLVGRFDRELLSLRRRAPAAGRHTHAAPPAVMVLGAGGDARRLRYGESIPELLYGGVGGADVYGAPMRVALGTDPDGNVFLGPAEAGRPGGAGALPLASDVLWLRQMAAYSSDLAAAAAAARPPPPAAAADSAAAAGGGDAERHAGIRVAAVTIPVNARGDVLVTQRAFRGIYNGMWVFPGGHVDKGEALREAGAREVREEAGIEVDPASLRPLAVWEGAVASRRRQFCVVFFSADATCGSAEECTMELQVKEVHRAVWVPRELVPRLLDTHALHDAVEMPGVAVVDGKQVPAMVRLSEVQAGLGGGHKFALRAFLDSRPEYMTTMHGASA